MKLITLRREVLCVLASAGLCHNTAMAQTVFLNFNTVGQYTNNFNPWNDNGGGNDLAKGSFGHHGARGSVIWIDPGKGLVMAFLMQAVDLKGKELDDIKRAFFKAVRELPSIPSENESAK